MRSDLPGQLGLAQLALLAELDNLIRQLQPRQLALKSGVELLIALKAFEASGFAAEMDAVRKGLAARTPSAAMAALSDRLLDEVLLVGQARAVPRPA